MVRKRQPDSPPGQEGWPKGSGWSIENLKKHSNTAFFRVLGNQPPLPPPVQEGNLDRCAKENLTALPLGGELSDLLYKHIGWLDGGGRGWTRPMTCFHKIDENTEFGQVALYDDRVARARRSKTRCFE